MATSPVAVDPTETKEETGKDNTENQGNLQVLWQNFNLIAELLFSIQCSKKTFLTGNEKGMKEISLWRQKEYCQLATPQRPQYRPKGYKQSNQQQIPAGWKEVLKKQKLIVQRQITRQVLHFVVCIPIQLYNNEAKLQEYQTTKLKNLKAFVALQQWNATHFESLKICYANY